MLVWAALVVFFFARSLFFGMCEYILAPSLLGACPSAACRPFFSIQVVRPCLCGLRCSALGPGRISYLGINSFLRVARAEREYIHIVEMSVPGVLRRRAGRFLSASPFGRPRLGF